MGSNSASSRWDQQEANQAVGSIMGGMEQGEWKGQVKKWGSVIGALTYHQKFAVSSCVNWMEKWGGSQASLEVVPRRFLDSVVKGVKLNGVEYVLDSSSHKYGPESYHVKTLRSLSHHICKYILLFEMRIWISLGLLQQCPTWGSVQVALSLKLPLPPRAELLPGRVRLPRLACLEAPGSALGGYMVLSYM